MTPVKSYDFVETPKGERGYVLEVNGDFATVSLPAEGIDPNADAMHWKARKEPSIEYAATLTIIRAYVDPTKRMTSSGSAATTQQMGAATGMNAPATLIAETAQKPVAPAPKSEQPKSETAQQHSTTEGPSLAQFTPATSKFVKPSSDQLLFVPPELKAKQNWVRWKLEPGKDGNPTKVPYQLNGHKASYADASQWTTYEAAIDGAPLDKTQGVGICFDGSVAAFDLDGCHNPATGEITEWAQRIIHLLGTYCEVTPSGYGVRVYALGKLPAGARRFALSAPGYGDKIRIDVFNESGYTTVTGDRISPTSTLESTNVLQAYELCLAIAKEFPDEKRKQAAHFGGDDPSSTVVFTPAPGAVVTNKLAVLMYGEITSLKHPFEIQDEHGNKVSADTQSEADLSLATLLAMKHSGDPELIDTDFRESALYRPKWEPSVHKSYQKLTVAKAIAAAQRVKEREVKKAPIIEIPAAPGTATSTIAQAPATAQTQAEIAAEASQDIEGTFPYGEQIPDFDESAITGVFRKLVDAICNGTTIPRQYALHAAKALACSILTRFKIELEDCESARTYFIVFGDTGTGKGLSFRRMQKILDQVQKTDQFVRVIHAVDSEAGLRDAFFEILIERNCPILFFVDEVKTLGHKEDGKKNPEIVDAVIELANNPTVSRTKSKKGSKDKASKTREDAWLLVYMCAQDGEAYATAFPRTKQQGLPDRFMPEYSPKVKAGRLPEPDLTAGAEAIIELIGTASKLHGMTMSPEARERVDEVWDSQPQEFQESPRLRQQFLLEMYLEAFNRGSAVAEAQDLTAAAKTLERQKAIRQKFFTEEIPNQVGVYQKRLKDIREDMVRRLRRGTKITDAALSVRDLMTQTLAYKENDLPNFNQAWKAQSPFWLECNLTGKNGHAYKKWIPTPEETDMWLPPDQVKGTGALG